MADDKPAPKFRAGDSDMERARAWWHDYGRAIVAGAVIGLSAVVGFNYWQHREQTRAEAASDLFATMHELIATHAGEMAAAEAEAEAKAAEEAAAAEAEAAEENAAEDESEEVADADTDDSAAETDVAEETAAEESATEDSADETAAETDSAESDETADADESAETAEAEEPEPGAETAAAIRDTAAELMSDYASTPYAVHAAFALAKLAVDDGDLAPAAQALEWILEHADTGDPVLSHIARLRLASVLLAQSEAGRAIELLRRPAETGDAAGFAARYDELTGDAHLQNGDPEAARAAYRRGLEQLSAGSIGHVLLKLKLDNLGG